MPSVEHSNPPWTADFDTIRREKLFRAPSAETTPFPALAEAFAPHTGSFDAVFEANGLLDLAIKDIGTKTFFDGGTLQDSSQPRNKVSIRIVKCFFQKPEIPPSNKISTSNRRIYPAECRERHSTYKGKFSVRLGVRINDDEWSEVVRDLGGLPIMLRVCSENRDLQSRTVYPITDCRPTSATSSPYRQPNWFNARRNLRSLAATSLSMATKS